MQQDQKVNLGDLLLERGIVDPQDLEKALVLQRRRLGQILIEEKLVKPEAVVQALKDLSRHPGANRETGVVIQSKLISGLGDVFSRSINLLTPDSKLLINTIDLYNEILEKKFTSLDSLELKLKLIHEKAKKDLNKNSEFKINLYRISLSTSLIRDLDEIFLHLIRNALDHGIENSDHRKAQNKSEKGNLSLDIKIDSNSIRIVFEDDGQGIDTDHIYQIAKSKNLTSKEKNQLAEEELYQFLFTPGFSTRSEKTEYSGLGFGLDIIEAMVLRNKGVMQIESKRGLFTRFLIQIPFVEAVFPAILFQKGEWSSVPYFNIESVSTDHLITTRKNEISFQEVTAPVPVLFQACDPQSLNGQNVLGVCQVLEKKFPEHALKKYLVVNL